MGADAVLVQASYAAAMANVPGDWSKIFNKQYEGLLLAHTAKMKMFGDAMEQFGEIGSSLIEKKNLEKQLREAEDQLRLNEDLLFGDAGSTTVGKLSTDNAERGVNANQQHYNNGGGSNVGMVISAQERFEDIKTQIKKISGKKFPSKKDKQKRMLLYKNFDLMKQGLIQDKASAIQYHEAGSGGLNSLINWPRMAELVDKGQLDGDLITLIKHVHDPNTNLEDYGIKVRYNEKNERIIDYFEGRLGIEYTVNNGGNMFNMMSYGVKPEVKSIKYKDLMGIIKYKATEEEANIEALFNRAGVGASETKKGTKTPVYSNWDGDVDENGNSIIGGLKSSTRRGIIAELKNVDVVNDLATRELFGTDRIYANDLKSHPGIDLLTYQMVLGKDLSQFDTNKDNELNAKERSVIGEDFLKEGDKAKIREVLTNPKNEGELVIAQNEFADYLTNLAGQHFKNNRPKKTLSAEELAAQKIIQENLKKSKTGMPWAPALPKDAFERKKYALVKSVMMNQSSIKDDDGDVWTREVDGHEFVWVNSDKSKTYRKYKMIQHVGRNSEYGNIPNDFDLNTIGTGTGTEGTSRAK